MSTSDSVRYRLDTESDLVFYPSAGVRVLSWYADLAMIQRFYRHFTDDEILPPDENEPECGDPIALVSNGEILSFAIFMSFREGETEIGAVATLPSARGRGLCRCVISEAARRILNSGKAAALTTRSDNAAMRTAAEAIGMKQLFQPAEEQ